MQTTLQFGSADARLLTMLILIAGSAALWHYFSLRKRAGIAQSVVMTVLRASLLSLLVFFILEPSLARQRRVKYRPTVAVAIDNSLSMEFQDGADGTRLDRVKSFLSSTSYRELTKKYFLEYFTFSESASPIAPEAVEGIEAVGRWTDLPGALLSISEESPPSLGAIIAFTDGGHDDFPMGGKRSSGQGDIPVVYVGAGGKEIFQDVEIVEVQSAGMSFAERPARFVVHVRSQGFAGRKLPLLMKEGGKVVLSREILFSGDTGDEKVEVSWTPSHPGLYHLSFEIPPQAGEEIKENNRVEKTLNAVRDKIRILLVSGRPSWTHRFLRDALKGDPTVDLVSFIILRTATDAVNAPQDELSLIPFPTKKIFLEELPEFDLVIFENFSYRLYFPAQYLLKVKEFVEAGGGFWMLGGPLSFVNGGYAGTPIGEILPVTLEPLPPDKGYVPEKFRPMLTPAGKRHPFFQGFEDVLSGNLPLLEGFNLSGPVREGSVTLVDHPRGTGDALPVVVLGRHGKGRTMAVLSDSLWKWSFEMAGQGKGNLLYLSLVRQAVRWSVGDPKLQPIEVEVETDRIKPGETLRATIRVMGEDYLPAVDSELEVALHAAGGESRIIPVIRESPGLFIAEVEMRNVGVFELVARATRGDKEYAADSAAFEVLWPSGEFTKPGFNREALQRLGPLEQGGIIELEQEEVTAGRLNRVLSEIVPVYRVEFEEHIGLGEIWVSLALIVTLLGTEWTIRRRCGMD